MSDASLPLAQWRHGPVRVASLPYLPGQRGEPQVRGTLADWLGDPAAPLARDPSGRPRLLAPHQDHDTGWSHSGDALLLALGEAVQLGVDIEALKPRPRARELAQRFFHPDETAWLHSLDDDTLQLSFIRLWCAKEAVLKAHGKGLSFGLEKLVFADDQSALRLVSCDEALGQPWQWSLQEWTPLPGYRAALAWRSAQAQDGLG